MDKKSDVIIGKIEQYEIVTNDFSRGWLVMFEDPGVDNHIIAKYVGRKVKITIEDIGD